jgi:1-acyl-sn-glycerol-3-phosphate acyltransferase
MRTLDANSAKKRRNQKPRRPSAPIYFLVCLLTRAYFKLFYGLRIDRSAIRGIKGPVVVLSNHQSNLDFLIVAATAYPLKLNFMVSTYFFHSSMLRFLLNLMGAFPKHQFIPDTSAIKSAMKVVSRGDNIGIFPEGQVCYSGLNCDIDESIAKLIKKLSATTISVAIRGNFLTCPKWSRSQEVRRGAIESKATVVVTSEEVKELSVGEIAKRAVDAVSYNEYEWQRTRMAKFRPKPRKTDGLEVILYRCPKCQSNFTIKSRDSEVFCEKCGYKVSLDSYGFFKTPDGSEQIYDNPAEWYRYQKQNRQQELENPAALPFVVPCVLHKTIEGKHGYSKCGEGTATLGSEGLFFEGTKDGEPFEVSTLYESQTNLPFSAAISGIDLHGENENYAVVPLEPRHMMYMVEGFAIMSRKARGQKQ